MAGARDNQVVYSQVDPEIPTVSLTWAWISTIPL